MDAADSIRWKTHNRVHCSQILQFTTLQLNRTGVKTCLQSGMGHKPQCSGAQIKQLGKMNTNCVLNLIMIKQWRSFYNNVPEPHHYPAITNHILCILMHISVFPFQLHATAPKFEFDLEFDLESLTKTYGLEI